ncbi:nucleoside diphosphate kinase regulator [Thalassospira alkalitolerans]|nr:nucleoside diphosphate kinase regulator [Thalassospira alkalitolerans]|tara:strand:+ start:63697 stop:64119 length:423 start_codon:yes stop_codon:yes gene_type:complete
MMQTSTTTFHETQSHDPAVFIDRAIAEQLENLARANLVRNPIVANRLLDEIDRALIVCRSELPPDTITIGSEVTFRDNATGNMQTVALVMPAEADISARRISIMTPVGAALIGIAKGETIWWQTPDHEVRELTIHDVVTP